MYQWVPIESHWVRVYCIGELKIGQILENIDSESDRGQRKRLVLIFPGNPGICQFYEAFAQYLYDSLPNSSVWVIANMNHDFESKPARSPLDKKCYTLSEQISHKLSFICSHIPPDGVKLILIGHSIGCYIILHQLRALASRDYKIERCFFLFPTIENMRKTPSGQNLTTLTRFRLHYFLLALSYLLNLTPPWFKDYLIRANLKRSNKFGEKSIEKCVIKAARQVFEAKIISNSIFMALDELKNVRQLDEDLMLEFYDKISIFYGQNDGWCPIEFYEKAKKGNIASKIVLCPPGIEHAFVIRDSDTVAKMIADDLLVPVVQ